MKLKNLDVIRTIVREELDAMIQWQNKISAPDEWDRIMLPEFEPITTKMKKTGAEIRVIGRGSVQANDENCIYLTGKYRWEFEEMPFGAIVIRAYKKES